MGEWAWVGAVPVSGAVLLSWFGAVAAGRALPVRSGAVAVTLGFGAERGAFLAVVPGPSAAWSLRDWRCADLACDDRGLGHERSLVSSIVSGLTSMMPLPDPWKPNVRGAGSGSLSVVSSIQRSSRPRSLTVTCMVVSCTCWWFGVRATC